MAEHFVRIVDDGTLKTGDGWVFARNERTECIYFVVERSTACDEEKLNEAWEAARLLVIEQAVREGIVEYRQPVAV